MTLLAIEAATEVCSVALWNDGLLIEHFDPEGRQGSRVLLPMIEQALNDTGLAWSDLDALAFGHGPGAFTGLRVVTGLVQGLALGHGLPVYGISCLAALAHALLSQQPSETDQPVLCVQDARMDEVYWGSYRPDGQGQVLAVQPDQLACPGGIQLDSAQAWRVAGNGVMYRSEIEAANPGVILVWDASVTLRASSVAALAAQRMMAGEPGQSAGLVRPLYLRNRVTHQAS